MADLRWFFGQIEGLKRSRLSVLNRPGRVQNRPGEGLKPSRKTTRRVLDRPGDFFNRPANVLNRPEKDRLTVPGVPVNHWGVF